METYAVLRTPQAIFYGRGSFNRVGSEASSFGKKALIISDKIMDGLGLVSECRDLLKKSGVSSVYYLGVNTEPTDSYVKESLELCTSENCDVIVGLGGGSCIDTAKAVAVLATSGGYIGDYIGARKVAQNTPIPLIAIPTTAGTGSEATDVTVITNTSNDVKMMIKQPAFMPTIAIVDPVLCQSAPKSVTASTGVDALSHAIEAYISKKSQPMTDILALSAMDLIIKNLVKSYQNGQDIDAREAMAIGSLQAGMAFSNASVCLVHGMSRPIGALFHVPHGTSNAMLLPAVLEFSKSACIDRLAVIGRLFQTDKQELSDIEAADLAVTEVKNLCLTLHIPNLQDWGIDKQKFESAINKMAFDAIESGSPGNNPRVPTQLEIEELYHICYNYQFSDRKILN
ncbi:iron-containing alcohol dehydrogenase [Cytobacillus sp. S13-E01]|uniref:iron-containing alcohol dehydrogenase n=1 Tax=Cytobacillus sp. S13-E01 TaxID=3031326 RepID=UPI0023D86452|nr:iron-containing alcohol dehydrogenase [Cytobacillus sp. S13-E01]MDF0726684.1 iron-containing alcohol dehydrogenase [Cytobacillus sp. S13-E01]